MKIDFSRKTNNPIECVRNSSQEPILIIYDVLGHFAKLRDHLGKSFCWNLNARAKNGFLFSEEKDVVITSSQLDSAESSVENPYVMAKVPEKIVESSVFSSSYAVKEQSTKEKNTIQLTEAFKKTLAEMNKNVLTPEQFQTLKQLSFGCP